MSETNQPPAEAQPAASGEELTCGELSCEECNERYAKARAEIESLRADMRIDADVLQDRVREIEALRKRVADLERDYVERGKWFSSETVRRKKAEQALSLAKGDTEAWNRSFHAERTQRKKAEAERDALAAQVNDLKFREDRQTGSWNTLANCADTLRSRDFGTDLGAIDERVIAMAKALDAARTERDAWKAKAEKLAAALVEARASFLGLQPDFGGPISRQMGLAIARINAALDEPKPDDQGAT
jgi:DNA repair exonuclease SbcCD ATPase subunit